MSDDSHNDNIWDTVLKIWRLSTASQSVRRDLDQIYALLLLSKGNNHSSGINWGKYSTNRVFSFSCLTAKHRPNSVGVV